MEVHAHTHTARKKWTHYFWEFLMLFLAVFCGFLAEYKLEHTLEHQRGKQYASTMLEDLNADKQALQSGIKVNNAIITYIDTLLNLYHPDTKQTKTTAQLYYYGRYGLRFWYYVDKQVTLGQMKHSGTIRYFQNAVLEKQMVKLDKEISFIKYWDDRERLFNELAISYSTRLFNYAFLLKTPIDLGVLEKDENDTVTYHPFYQTRDLFLQSDPPLVNKQSELIAEFLNFCNQRIPLLRAKIFVYKNALLEMEKITNDLMKEYDLSEGTPLEK